MTKPDRDKSALVHACYQETEASSFFWAESPQLLIQKILSSKASQINYSTCLISFCKHSIPRNKVKGRHSRWNHHCLRRLITSCRVTRIFKTGWFLRNADRVAMWQQLWGIEDVIKKTANPDLLNYCSLK